MSKYIYRTIGVEVVCEDGVDLPKYEKDGDACMDLRAYIPEGYIKLHPGDIKLVKTGMRITLPDMYEAQIRSRSGLALKYGVIVLNSPGTIDSGYRGDVGVILANLGDDTVVISNKDRIAQISIHKTNIIRWVKTDILTSTERSDGGFGSTGGLKDTTI